MATPLTKKKNKNSLVLVNKEQPQVFNFDETITFEETPIKKTMPVEILIDKQLNIFKAESSLFYSNKIRIVCEKSFPVVKDDSLYLNLTAFYTEFGKDFFIKIPCTLIKVEVFQNITHVLLTFSNQANQQFIDWYQQWIIQFQDGVNRKEINESAFNFIFQYYKRLYSAHLTHPILLSNEQSVVHAYASRACLNPIMFNNEGNEAQRIPVEIFQQLVKHQDKESRLPLYVWHENDTLYYFLGTDHPEVSSKQLISWLRKKPQWRVFLICNRKIAPLNNLQCNEIKEYISETAISGNESFEQSFSELLTITHILDISCLYSHIGLPAYSDALSANKISAKKRVSEFKSPSFQVKRTEHRFYYKTKLTLTLANKSQDFEIETETIDLSFLGLSINLPLADYPFKEKDTIMVEFSEWNELRTQESTLFNKIEPIESVAYKIVLMGKKQNIISLGLLRSKRDTAPAINDFIRKKIESIEKSEPGRLTNNFDLYQSLLSSVSITNNIVGLPFFLGKDSEGKRIIQALAFTQENINIRKPHQDNHNDWSFLQQIASSLDIAIVKAGSNNNNLKLGIYCYYDESQEKQKWITRTDLNFNSTEDKTAFIHTAISHKKHFFYHCSLIPITQGKDDILNGESCSFISLAAHRLKEIHEICHSILALGELTNLTRLISFIYR